MPSKQVKKIRDISISNIGPDFNDSEHLEKVLGEWRYIQSTLERGSKLEIGTTFDERALIARIRLKRKLEKKNKKK